MEYLQYQLHIWASTLAIIRFVFNLSSNYTICVVYSGGTRSHLQKWVKTDLDQHLFWTADAG
jgi:hypothetical protein